MNTKTEISLKLQSKGPKESDFPAADREDSCDFRHAVTDLRPEVNPLITANHEVSEDHFFLSSFNINTTPWLTLI